MMSSAGTTLGCVINLRCKNRNGSEIRLRWHLRKSPKKQKRKHLRTRLRKQAPTWHIAFAMGSGITHLATYASSAYAATTIVLFTLLILPAAFLFVG